MFVSNLLQWFSPGTQIFSTNKTDLHDIAEILLKLALKTTTNNPNPIHMLCSETTCHTIMGLYLVLIELCGGVSRFNVLLGQL